MKPVRKILSAFLALSLIAGISVPSANAYVNPQINVIYAKSEADINEIADEVRTHLVNRDTEFTLNIPFEAITNLSDDIDRIMALAVKDMADGSPVEGDYLAWTTGASAFGFTPDRTNSCYKASFSMSYHTTAEQEAELDEKIAEILDKLNVYNSSDYEKIRAVHDYITANVSYSTENSSLKYTAYGAAIQGKAVCQGYSLLMYRLLSELGINVRNIPGTAGGPHMWNLVELDGKYYYVDVTFDSGMGGDYYFLKGSEDFDSDSSPSNTHIFDAEIYDSPLYADYADGDFLARFNISPVAYSPEAISYSLGELNGDNKIDANDATIVLSAYTLISTGNASGLTESQELSADVNSDGKIDSADASLIIRYYSAVSTGSSESLEDFISAK